MASISKIIKERLALEAELKAMTESFERRKKELTQQISQHKEQEPTEWNDADMRETRQNLISCCRDWERGEKTTLLPVVAVHARYFLEHLTEPQKPAEWSEEDKHCIHQLILFCENCMQQDSEAIRCATWLKSLRPQLIQDKFDSAMHVADKFEEGYKAGVYDTKAKSWKPSEEQMEAVEEALEFYSGTTDTAKGLRSLYNDLKKL